MAQFKYSLPSGADYIVEAPQGTTQATADFVFYSQVAAGVFTGYAAGQTLQSVATRLAEFNLSRVERDTAGVENATVLSIVQQSRVLAPVPDLTKVPIQDPITQADLAQIDLNAVPPVGPLPPEQVAALIAQKKNLVPAGSVTAYGFTCEQLERVGVFKPGVCSRDTFQCNLNSPDSWTGAYNINSYNELVNNESAQIQIQAALLQQAYDSLTAAGIIQPAPAPAVSITTGEVWTNSRGLVEATAAGVLTGQVKAGSTLYNSVYSNLNGSGGFGVSQTIQTGLGALTLAGGAISAVNNLTNSVNQNISSALGVGNTVANLGTTVSSIADRLINTNLSSIASDGVSVLKNTINGGIGSITNTVAGSVGALVSNASQFGTAVTGLWAGGGFSNLGGIAQGVSSGLTSAFSGVNSTVASLTNLTTGLPNLSSLSSLTGLNTGALGNLGSLLSGNGFAGAASSALGSLQGVASGALGSVTNLVSGTLGNLGSIAQNGLGSLSTALDLGGKMSSFSIDFSVFSNSGLASKVQKAPAFTNTVDRAGVDVAVQQVLGNPKIPVPSFETPQNASTTGAQLDINYAQNILNSITSPVSSLLTQGQAVVNQGQQLAGTVTTAFNRLTG